jgi:hypothetical protein
MDTSLNTIELVVTIIASFIASSGFWALIMRVLDKKSATTQLILGLAHNQIVTLGMQYIERGMITADEYEDFVKYLYKPYAAHGGNGLAERVMKDIEQLPICTGTIVSPKGKPYVPSPFCIDPVNPDLSAG